MHAAVYGLDIGGTKMELAIYDANLQVCDQWRVPTPTRDYAQFLEVISEQIAQADRVTGRPLPLGIAMPGVTDESGRQISSNVPCAHQMPVIQDLQQRLQRPVAIENDCRCFALSEAQGGAGDGAARVFGAILGTGAAGGLCIEGRLYKGRQNAAGEYGHQPVSAQVFARYKLPLFACGCGLTGCAEPYVSGTGLANIFSHFLKQPTTTFEALAQLRSGMPEAQQAFACWLDFAGCTFASLVLAYDPDVIVLGGGLSQAPEILDALPAALSPHLFKGIVVPPIRAARFGDASGKRGAALLGLQHAQR